MVPDKQKWAPQSSKQVCKQAAQQVDFWAWEGLSSGRVSNPTFATLYKSMVLRQLSPP